MQYEPIKRSLGLFFSGPLFMRKALYFLMDLLLLRTWHVRKSLRKIRTGLPSDAIILDAGSGMGQYSWRMSRMNPEWKITGIDINSEEVESCNLFFKRSGLAGRVGFRCSDLSEYIEPETYDLVLSVDVMEHIAEDEKVFRNFYASLKKKGVVLISTPSDQGGSDAHGKDDESFIGEHVRNGYGQEEIRTKLCGAGFKDINVSYTYGKHGSISWLLLMKYPVKMLNASRIFYLLLPVYYLVAFPISLILNILDVRFKHSTGTGLLVTARKIQE